MPASVRSAHVAGEAMIRWLIPGLVLFVASTFAQNDARSPVPMKAELADSEKLVKELFKADFAKTKPADRSALAAKLLEQAEGTRDDPRARYVLLREARGLAALAGDTELYLQSATAMSTCFNVSLTEAQDGAVNVLAANVVGKDRARETGEALLGAVDAAIGAGEFEQAQHLLAGAEQVSRKANHAPLSAAVAAHAKSLPALRKEFDKIADAQKTLESMPTDGPANLVVGRFLCFVQRDWETGLPRLALGNDAELQAAAEKDSKAAAGTSREKMTAAETWDKIGAAAEPLLKTNIQSRALRWYRDGAADATGLAKARAENRIKELAKNEPPAGPLLITESFSIWDAISGAVKEKKVKEWSVGITPGQKEYRDAPENGGILIGFHYMYDLNNRYIEYLRPIYRGSDGEIDGVGIGTIRTGGQLHWHKANAGWALASLAVAQDATGIETLELVNMKVSTTAFAPNSAGAPVLLGKTTSNGKTTTKKTKGVVLGAGSKVFSAGGDGAYNVGIHGTVSAVDGRPTSICLISLSGVQMRATAAAKVPRHQGRGSGATTTFAFERPFGFGYDISQDPALPGAHVACLPGADRLRGGDMMHSLVLGLAVLVGSALAQADSSRPAVPSKAELVEAEKLVKTLYKAEYAKTKAADRAAFAATLLGQAADTKDDLKAKYVLLHEARDMAARGGDHEDYLKAADEIAATFKVSPAEARAASVDLLAGNVSGADNSRDVGQGLLDSVDGALGVGDWGSALKLLRATEALGRKSGSAPLTTAIALRSKSLVALRRDYEKIGDAQKKLETTPTDEPANLLVGKFLCFVKNDWENGLPRLVLGSEGALRSAAEKDSKAATGAATDKVEAAETWHKLAASLDPLQKSNLDGRALFWFRESLADSVGLAKIRVEKRIEELAKATAAPASDGLMNWALIKTAVKEGNLKEWQILGGGQKNWKDVPATGGVLIGFRYSASPNNRIPDFIQPIYRGPKGEFLGAGTGTANVRTQFAVSKAKAGYAVGAIFIRSGAWLDAIQPVFMKMTATGVDPSDSYKGIFLGGDGGSGTMLGDGNFVVGVHGRVDGGNGHIQSLSPITMTNLEAKAIDTKKDATK